MYVLFANDSLIYDFLSNKIQKKKKLQPPDGVHVESLWIPSGVFMESRWSPTLSNRKCNILSSPGGVQMKSTGLHMELWSPDGIGGAG
jgi:hypothetical protein